MSTTRARREGRGQPAGDVAAQLARQPWARARAGGRHDERRRAHQAPRLGRSDHGRLGDPRVLCQRPLDVGRADQQAVDLEELVGAAEVVERAAAADDHVLGAEPGPHAQPPGEVVPAPVADGGRGRPHPHQARRAVRQRPARAVGDPHVDARRHAGEPGRPGTARQGDVPALRRAEAVHERGPARGGEAGGGAGPRAGRPTRCPAAPRRGGRPRRAGARARPPSGATAWAPRRGP